MNFAPSFKAVYQGDMDLFQVLAVAQKESQWFTAEYVAKKYIRWLDRDTDPRHVTRFTKLTVVQE
jgi:hypothetical protein